MQACCPCVTTPTFTRHPREATLTLTLTYTARTTAPDTRLWVGRVNDVMIVMGTSLDLTFTIIGDNPELDIYINTYPDI